MPTRRLASGQKRRDPIVRFRRMREEAIPSRSWGNHQMASQQRPRIRLYLHHGGACRPQASLHFLIRFLRRAGSLDYGDEIDRLKGSPASPAASPCEIAAGGLYQGADGQISQASR
jgi:hypothetical protein